MDLSELSTSLRIAITTLHKGLRKQIYSLNTYSMTELETISHLARNTSLLPSELAALTRVKTQSMSQIVRKLEEQGMVNRTASKEDKRKVYLSLTSRGKKMVEKTRYEGDELLKGLIEKKLSAAEKQLLVKALPVLYKLTETK
jgi:DNA-binding MarR family transcriptional regulator